MIVRKLMAYLTSRRKKDQKDHLTIKIIVMNVENVDIMDMIVTAEL